MYIKYTKSRNWEYEILDETNSSVLIEVIGKNSYKDLLKESGKHVIQRVPPTEKKGRRHTSVLSVSVMELIPYENTFFSKDVEITTCGSSIKAGGQNVNKVESTVRAKHMPTGISVRVDGRDQGKNKQIALQLLEQKVTELETQKIQDSFNKEKSEQLAGSNRSGKIRTYNFIKGFVSNELTGQQTRDIKNLMKGKLDLIREIL